jgi:3-oxoacyl-[acyl-carrier-protein] synthase-1
MVHRVAITGVGIVSCLGRDRETVAGALHAGRSGIVVDEERRALGFISPLTGRIPEFTPRFPLSRKQKKSMPLFAEWAYEAAMQAVEQSGIDPEDLKNDRTGLLFGCDSSALAAVEQTRRLLETKDTTNLGSGLIFRTMTSCVTMNLNSLLGTKGASWSISGACASGGHAVGQAADLIRLGRQERMICGGAQEINWQSICSFDGLKAFSPHADDPAGASRPFAAGRDGLVPGGGAAAVMLERMDSAKKRGAAVLGEVKGYGFSSDGENIIVPSRTGLGRAMRMALEQAETAPSQISYVCAHATSTPVGDAVEADNIVDVLGEKTVPVSSVKSMTGHEFWMSGASQVVYTTLMAGCGFLAPNINFDGPDEHSARLDIVTETRDAPIRTAMCNSAGFGGTNSSLVLGFERT